MVKPGADLIRLLTYKVERAGRSVYFKMFSEVTSDQFIQNCSRDLRFSILIRHADDVAVLGYGSSKAGVNGGGSCHDRRGFDARKHPIRSQSLRDLDRQVPACDNGNL